MGRLKKIDLWIPIIIGTVAFICITGGKIIIPTYRDWLMIGDAAENFTGWQFFRHTPVFQWPLGANPRLGLGYSNSIFYTDSIPLPAIVFKFLNPLLPQTFQYFGMWIWLSFVLQAVFGWKLLSNFITHRVQLAIGCLFFTISPVLLYRLVHDGYGHIGLASQWLVLASLHLYFSQTFQFRKWVLLTCVSTLIHPYILMMVIAIWIATMIKHLLAKTLTIKSVRRHLAVVGLLSVLALWASGFFMVWTNHTNMDSWNYVFRWQPLSLIDSGTDNSIGWSRLLPDREQLTGDTEGFSYLGSGIIVLGLILLCFRIAHVFKTPGRPITRLLGVILLSFTGLTCAYLVATGSSTRMLVSTAIGTSILVLVIWEVARRSMQHRGDSRVIRRNTPILVATSLMAIYSLTNQIGIGLTTLVTYPLVGPIRQFTEIFRTHGRFIWPAYYLLVLFVFVEFCRKFGSKLATTVLIVCLTFQIYDSAEALHGVNDRFTNTVPWSSPMQDPHWSQFAEKYENVIVVPPLQNDRAGRWIGVTDFAGTHHLATNSGYFARLDSQKFDHYRSELYDNISESKFDLHSLYIIEDVELWNRLSSSVTNVFYIGELDGYNVIAP
jgi:hypothetical protein